MTGTILFSKEQVLGIQTFSSMPDIPKEFIVNGIKYKVTIEKEAERTTEITLEDTIEMMRGDWQDRFRAEYWQVKNRADRLGNMLEGWFVNALEFKLNCPYGLLDRQLHIMKEYIWLLEKRAKIEGIDLDRRVEE